MRARSAASLAPCSADLYLAASPAGRLHASPRTPPDASVPDRPPLRPRSAPRACRCWMARTTTSPARRSASPSCTPRTSTRGCMPYDFAPLRTDIDLGLIPEAGPFGGATRLAASSSASARSADRVLHLDSGDCFQGAPIFNVNFGEVEFRFLSRVRLDAAVDRQPRVRRRARSTSPSRRATSPPSRCWPPTTSGTTRASSAVEQDRRSTPQPYTIQNVEGRAGRHHRHGQHLLAQLDGRGRQLAAGTPLEQNEAARGYVELLKPVTDLIVIVSHLGLTEDQDLHPGLRGLLRVRARSKPLHRPREHDPWTGARVGSAPEDDRQDRGARAHPRRHRHRRHPRRPPARGAQPAAAAHRPRAAARWCSSHSGAFAKYLGRLDVVVQMPPEGAARPRGAEVVSHDYRVFPVDALWCDDAMHALLQRRSFWAPGEFARRPAVRAGHRTSAATQEDGDTTSCCSPTSSAWTSTSRSPRIFAYAPRDIARRNNSTGGDSPLGNLAADSMRKRRRVEAEVALTNSLGIRDNLYAGPLTQESMFNVFPFENTINIMYLSGVEMQEMFDFVAERSAEPRLRQPGAGLRRALHDGLRPGAAQRPAHRLRPDGRPAATAQTAPTEDREGRAPWQCLDDVDRRPLLGAPGHRHPDQRQAARPARHLQASRSTTTSPRAARASRCSSATPRASRPASPCATRSSATCRASAPATICSTGATGQHVGKTGAALRHADQRPVGGGRADARASASRPRRFKDALSQARSGSCTCRARLCASRTPRLRRCGGRRPSSSRMHVRSVPPGPVHSAAAAAATRWRATTRSAATSPRQLRSFCENPTHGDRHRRRGRPHRPEGQVMKRCSCSRLARRPRAATPRMATLHGGHQPLRRQLLPGRGEGLAAVNADTGARSRWRGQLLPGALRRQPGAVPAAERGTPSCPYAIPAAGGRRRRRHRARHARDRRSTAFSGPVSFRVVPGDLTGDYRDRWTPLTDGEGTGTVRVSHLYGEVRVWVEDAPPQLDSTPTAASPATRASCRRADSGRTLRHRPVAARLLRGADAREACRSRTASTTAARPWSGSSSPSGRKPESRRAARAELPRTTRIRRRRTQRRQARHDGGDGTDPGGFFVTDITACRVREVHRRRLQTSRTPEPDGYLPGTYGSMYIYNYSFPEGSTRATCSGRSPARCRSSPPPRSSPSPRGRSPSGCASCRPRSGTSTSTRCRCRRSTCATAACDNLVPPFVTDALCGHNPRNMKMESLESALVSCAGCASPRCS